MLSAGPAMATRTLARSWSFQLRDSLRVSLWLYSERAVVVVEGVSVHTFRRPATMMFIGIVVSIAAIAALCYLLFTLAVYALPAVAGFTAAAWAHQTGAGWAGGMLVGLVVAAMTLAAGHLLTVLLRPMWLRFVVALAFVAPAGIAGFHATHGIVKHLMPSETWQFAFSLSGAVAVAVTTLIRITAISAPGPGRQRVART